MPADALPQPWDETVTSVVLRYRRRYLDALQRPMKGSLMISGAQRVEAGGLVVTGAAVRAEVVDGLLDIELPPGEYRARGVLTNIDGQRVDEDSSFTV